MRRSFDQLLMLVCALPLLQASCSEVQAPVEIAVRPVKTITIDSRASGTVRSFSGAIVASEISSLAFRVGGTVQTVDVDLGQTVRRGQVLATMDRTPFQLRVQQALAEVRNAQAARVETRDRRARTRRLFEAGAASRADIDRVVAEDEAAAGALAATRAALDLARRDLEDTVLEAPFDGLVAEKQVEAFEEVAVGHTAFVLHTSGAVEIEVLLPEALIQEVHVGEPVSVQLTSVGPGGDHFEGRVKEIGSAALQTNAFPVTVALESDDERLRPGLSAEATFTFRAGDGESWLVPVNAFLPKPGDDQSAHISERELTVFIVDPETETVSRRTVKPLGLRGNDLLVAEGLAEGERVVVAGVSFLHDGQKVRLVEPDR